MNLMVSSDDSHFTAFAALQNFHALLSDREESHSAVTAAMIVAYARRATVAADLAIERALRMQPGARRLHAIALGQAARASSLSVAAAADRVTQRLIGDWRLELIEEVGGLPWLVIHAPPGAVSVTMLEMRRPDGEGRRLDIGVPIDNVFQLPIDSSFAELAGLIELLQDPMTELHLL
jgi:hypothetical protein